MMFSKSTMVSSDRSLPGRATAMAVPASHFVNGHPLSGPWPDGFETAVFALGCFWGAERVFWQTPGVWSTSVGYAGGYTPNPTYEEVCSGLTGHTEAVMVVFDPSLVTYAELLAIFWEHHDPTQGMRQGNDRGTQYRSAVYTNSTAQADAAEASRAAYQLQLDTAGYGPITTEMPRGVWSSTSPIAASASSSAARIAASMNPEATTLNTLPSKECAPARMRIAEARS